MDIEEFEREGQGKYAAFATTVAAILTAAIGAETDYRLQQVKERAKQPASLRKKLEQRGIAATTTLENDIKDLAGCRIIFYTNSDVSRFINSGIIHQNFEILDAKLHHPKHTADDSSELYISNHYLVGLRPERIALPEYGRFAGMKCEIQIQTILNHAWAEMAHDTIYKAPALGDFGGKAFDDIESRMRKVARKYLVPAGYEFQKIANDFQRLIEGKKLFDGDALEAIVEAVNNNDRAEALEKFADNVLPLYDDLPTAYHDVVSRLIVAADRARAVAPVEIETPYGALPAKTYKDIVKAISDILTRYRYHGIETTFDAVCKLYGWAESENEWKPLLELSKSMAKHQLHIWRQHGPIAQVILTEQIGLLSDDERRGLGLLIVTMLGEVLGTEVSGTTNSSTTVTFHRRAVVASDALRDVRAKAIDLLKHQFALAESDKERRAVLRELQAATRTPISSNYDNALAHLVMNNTRTIIEYQTEIAPTLNHQLMQTTEDWVLHVYWRYYDLPESMRNDPNILKEYECVLSAALAFRDVANANPDFVIYKTLVGFNSVFTPDWEDKEFHYRHSAAYRAEQVDALLASIQKDSMDVWFDRINRYALTESNDAATFPIFNSFIDRLAEAQPLIFLSYLDRLEAPLTNFLPSILAGLMRSTERTKALAQIDVWLHAGKHLRPIAWHLRFADPFDESLLRRVLDFAIQHGDKDAVRNVLVASATQFAAYPGTLIEQVFMPSLRNLHEAGDLSWVRMHWLSWLGNPIIRALSESQASIVLDALVHFPILEDGADDIVAAIAERWPAIVLAFLGTRRTLAQIGAAPLRYNAIPFSLDQLQAPLAAVPDMVLHTARTWFDADPLIFTYDGGRLLASVFPGLSNGLDARLATLIAGGNEADLAFVLGILRAFEGNACVYEHVRMTVAALVPESKLLNEAHSVLRESGVITGEFGSAELHTKRKTILEPWLADPSENVRMFATQHIHELDLRIAAETRSAEASIAMRKLEHGEELDGGEER
jgi:ppGpp synthetase/RelA/SpoT-type nucleotidyltranferase